MSEITVNEEGFRTEAETLINAAMNLHWDELDVTPQCTIPSVNYFADVYEQLRTYINYYSMILIRDVSTITDIAVAFLEYDNAMANLSPYDHWFNTAPIYLDPSIVSYETITPSQCASWTIDSDELDEVVAGILSVHSDIYIQLENIQSLIRAFADTENFTGDAARSSLLYFQRVHLSCCDTIKRCVAALERCASHHWLLYRDCEDYFVLHFSYSEEQLNGIITALTAQDNALQDIEPTLYSQTDGVSASTGYEYDYSFMLPSADELYERFSESVASAQCILDRVEEYESALVTDCYPIMDELLSLLSDQLQSTIENAQRYQYTYPPLPENDPIRVDDYALLTSNAVSATEDYIDDVGITVDRISVMVEEDDDFLPDIRGNWNNIASNFNMDYIGAGILVAYLLPFDGDLYLNNSYTTEYMEANDSLTCGTRTLIDQYIADPEHSMEIGESIEVDITVHMEMENGEGIVGYQYLHGTSANAGDFHVTGTITRLSETSYGCDMTYTWNDEIDPNFSYSSDSIKDQIAQAITHGRCEPYNIHITWSDYSVIGYTEEDEVSGWLRNPTEDYIIDVRNTNSFEE